MEGSVAGSDGLGESGMLGECGRERPDKQPAVQAGEA